jgi:hypothetical protein
MQVIKELGHSAITAPRKLSSSENERNPQCELPCSLNTDCDINFFTLKSGMKGKTLNCLTPDCLASHVFLLSLYFQRQYEMNCLFILPLHFGKQEQTSCKRDVASLPILLQTIVTELFKISHDENFSHWLSGRTIMEPESIKVSRTCAITTTLIIYQTR